MTHIESCPICGASSFEKFLDCKDYTVSHETFCLQKCVSCSFVVTTPRPFDTQLGKFYLSDDYISHTGKAASVIDRIYLTARDYTLRWKLALLNSRSNSKKRLLDFGCGTGDFITFCKSNGWDVEGVEPSDRARQIASQKSKQLINEDVTNLPDNQFDVITLWHVLEHLPDLSSSISLISSKLKAEGTLFIAVPNYASWDGQHYKNLWAGYDVPRHLWHFSTETMNKLLSQHGLKVHQIKPMKLDAYYVSLLSEKYKANKNSVSGMITAFINGTISNLKAARTGQYSSLIYIITK